jgi:hypothetical protein
MSLLLITCGVINRVFEVPSCIIKLKEFKPLENRLFVNGNNNLDCKNNNDDNKNNGG